MRQALSLGDTDQNWVIMFVFIYFLGWVGYDLLKDMKEGMFFSLLVGFSSLLDQFTIRREGDMRQALNLGDTEQNTVNTFVFIYFLGWIVGVVSC